MRRHLPSRGGIYHHVAGRFSQQNGCARRSSSSSDQVSNQIHQPFTQQSKASYTTERLYVTDSSTCLNMRYAVNQALEKTFSDHLTHFRL